MLELSPARLAALFSRRGVVTLHGSTPSHMLIESQLYWSRIWGGVRTVRYALQAFWVSFMHNKGMLRRLSRCEAFGGLQCLLLDVCTAMDTQYIRYLLSSWILTCASTPLTKAPSISTDCGLPRRAQVRQTMRPVSNLRGYLKYYDWRWALEQGTRA